MTREEAYLCIRSQLPEPVMNAMDIVWTARRQVWLEWSPPDGGCFRYKFPIPFYGIRKKGTIKLAPELVAELCLLA